MIKYLLLGLLVLSFTSLPTQAQETDVIQIVSSAITIDYKQDDFSEFQAALYIIIDSNAEISTFTIKFQYTLQNVETSINGTSVPNFLQLDESNTELSVTSNTGLFLDDMIILEIEADIQIEIDTVNDAEQQLFISWLTSPTPSFTNISLILPAGAVITKSQDELDIFPQVSEITTDGQRMTVNWYNLPKNSQISRLFIQFTFDPNQQSTTVTTTNQSGNTPLVVVLTLLLVVLGSISGYLYWLNRKIKSKPVKDESKTQIKTVIKPIVLKPYELDVLSTIADFGGGINQSELVKALDVSKSRVSQYLSEFEQKGLIKKVKMGRENIIQLNIDEADLLDDDQP